MTTSTEQRKAKLFARTNTDALVTAMVALDAVADPSREEVLTLAWIRGELERRIPAVNAAIEKAFAEASGEEERTGNYVDVDYGAVILTALEGATK